MSLQIVSLLTCQGKGHLRITGACSYDLLKPWTLSCSDLNSTKRCFIPPAGSAWPRAADLVSKVFLFLILPYYWALTSLQLSFQSWTWARTFWPTSRTRSSSASNSPYSMPASTLFKKSQVWACCEPFSLARILPKISRKWIEVKKFIKLFLYKLALVLPLRISRTETTTQCFISACLEFWFQCCCWWY